MRVGQLRQRLARALLAAMRSRGPDGVALTADRAKAMGAALAGRSDDDEVDVDELRLSTRAAAAVLGFHPEHVRRLVRTGRIPARREGGDYWIGLDGIWPLLDARHGPPGSRRHRR